MSVIEASIEVEAPLRACYDQWTQFEEFPKFMEGVESVAQMDDTHLTWVAEIAGQTRSWVAEITEQIPDERVAWRSRDGAVTAGVVTFHRIDDLTTRIMLQLEFQPEGLVEQAGDRLGLIKMRTEGDLKRFKEFLEARGTATGGWRGKVDRPDDLNRNDATIDLTEKQAKT